MFLFPGLQLLIEGVRGNGAQGDIAVDDITMTDKNCSQVHRGKMIYWKVVTIDQDVSTNN